MKLSELLKNIKTIDIQGDADADITGVNIDSRRIEKGHLFVAIKGTQTRALRGPAGRTARECHLCASGIDGKCCRSCCHIVLRRPFKQAEIGWCHRNQRKNDHRHLII